MKDTARKFLIVLLSVLMIGGSILDIRAEEETEEQITEEYEEIEDTDNSQPMPMEEGNELLTENGGIEPENLEDDPTNGEFTSSIGFTSTNTEIWAVNNDESTYERTSLTEDEMIAEFDRNVTKMLDYQLISTDAAEGILKNADGFRLNGGLKSGLLNTSNPYLSAIGLENADDCIDTDLDGTPDVNRSVYVMDDGTNGLTASSYIYVVDQDSICIVVEDEHGMGIGNALVTIAYDKNGSRVTRSMRTTNGNVKGVAAFNDMDTFNYCLLDISADGYESTTMLKETLTAGEKRTISLKKTEANSLYVRGLDLNGKDMIHSDTDLILVSENFATREIPFSVLLTATGDQQLPGQIELYSETRKKVIATFDQGSGYDIGGENTAMFTMSRKWMNQNISPLAEDDQLVLRYAGRAYKLENVRIKNAVRDPGADNNVSMPVFESTNSFSSADFNKDDKTSSFADIVHSTGMLNGSYKLGSVNVTIGWYPDGGFYVLTTIDIKKLSHEWGDIFENTWDPAERSDFNKVMDKFRQDFWDQVSEAVKNNEGLNPDVNDDGLVKEISSSYGGYKSTASIFIGGKYNTKTTLWEGTACGAFSIKWNGGRYTYYLIPAGPIVIPAYAGIEGGITGRGTLEFQMAWKNGLNFDDVQTTPQGVAALRIDIMPYLLGYFGLGIKGIVSGQIDLSATLDAGFKLEPFSKKEESVFRPFLNVIFKAAVKANFLLFSAGYTLASSDWIRLLGNVEPPYIVNMAGSDNTSSQAYRVDLSAAEEKAVLTSGQVENSDGTMTLSAYRENIALMSDANLNLSEQNDISLVSSNTYSDGQIQMISTRNHTALFRIITDGNDTKLVYHKVNADGSLSNDYHVVDTPQHYSVLEYSVVPNKANINDPEYQDNVYIAMVCSDASKETMEGIMESSFVAGAIIDLGEDRQVFTNTYDAHTDELNYYYQPLAAGNGDQMIVAFKRSDVTKNPDGTFDLNQDKARNIVFYIADGQHYVSTLLSKGDLFTDGAWYETSDPVFWSCSTLSTGERTTAYGISADGSFGDVNGKAFKIILEKPEGYTLAEGEHFISHWEMLNKMIYIISCGHLYYMDTRQGTYQFKEMSKNTQFQNSGSTYQFFMSADQKVLYLAGMKPQMDPYAGGVTGSQLEIYTIYNTASTMSDYYFATLHGPLEIPFDDITPSSFTVNYAANGAGTNQDKGFSLAFQIDHPGELTEAGTIKESTDLYYWNQASNKGLIVEDVSITNSVISKADQKVYSTVTFKNAGYRIAGPLRFLVQSTYVNEQGQTVTEELQQLSFNPNIGWWKTGANEGHYYCDLYAGDEHQVSVVFEPSPNWQPDREYEITVSIDPNYNYRHDDTCPVMDKDYAYDIYEGNRLSSSASTGIEKNRLKLNGQLAVVNGEHMIELSIRNESYYMSSDPEISIIPEYDYSWTDHNKGKLESSRNTQTVSLGAGMLLDSNTDEDGITAQTYNKSISVEKLLKDGATKGIRGITVCLLDDSGNAVNSTKLYFDNPYYKIADEKKEISSVSQGVIQESEQQTEPVKGEAQKQTTAGVKVKKTPETEQTESESGLMMNRPQFVVESDLDLDFSNQTQAIDAILTDEEKEQVSDGDPVLITLQARLKNVDPEEAADINAFLKQQKRISETDEVQMSGFTLQLSKAIGEQLTEINQLSKAVGLTLHQKVEEGQKTLLLRKTKNGYELVGELDASVEQLGFDVVDLNDEYILVEIRNAAVPEVIEESKACSVHRYLVITDTILLLVIVLILYGFRRLTLPAAILMILLTAAGAVLTVIYGCCSYDLIAAIVSVCVISAVTLSVVRITNSEQ